MDEIFVAYCRAAGAHFGDDALDLQGVPQNNGVGEQTEARGSGSNGTESSIREAGLPELRDSVFPPSTLSQHCAEQQSLFKIAQNPRSQMARSMFRPLGARVLV
jgi:hypothetical protein